MEIKITSNSSTKLFDFAEIWRFRELFYIFVWRDLKVRYKQTVIGILWVIIQPIVSMIIFTILFSSIAKIPSGKMPYSLFVLSGLTYWTFFQTSLAESIESIISNQNIVKKIYFPRIILVLSSVINRIVDFFINFLILLIYAVILGFRPNLLGLLILILVLFISAVLSSGIGLFLAALNVKYRDIRYVYPYILQIGFYLTPVVYPLSVMSERNRM